MIKYNRISSLIFSSFSFLIMSNTYANDFKGDVKVTYKELYAINLNGTICSKNDEECLDFKEKCNSLYGSMLNSEASLNYNINTETLIQSAILTYNNIKIPFFPAGIDGKYTFISSEIPDEYKNSIKIIEFSLVNNLENGLSNIHFLNKESNEKYQCILTSK